MATKTFKIGEYAIGGIIKVITNGQSVTVQCIDYFTKKEISKESFRINDSSFLINHLEDLTTNYYADKIYKWIETKVEFKN